MNSRYVEWLQKQGVQLYKVKSEYWRMYQGALVSAPATISYVNILRDEAYAVIKKSGAKFMRYSSEPCEEVTEWWNIVCHEYDIEKLSSNTRSKITRGNKRCLVRNINTEWLANNGYGCYIAAFGRYNNMNPMNTEEFCDHILSTIGGPFEYWGVFVKNCLVGYCQCIIEENEVATSVFKYNPYFLKDYTSYALINALLTRYVFEQGKRVSNGARSIAHDTNTQDFLLKFGFRKQYCHLNIVYQPLMSLAVRALYPWRVLIDRLPNSGNIHKVRSLLFQEKLYRSFGHP